MSLQIAQDTLVLTLFFIFNITQAWFLDFSNDTDNLTLHKKWS